MGIHSRDYIRDSYEPTRFGGGGGAVVCKRLIIVTVVVFLLQLLTRNSITPWLSLDSRDLLLRGQVWRILTYAFCHSADGGLPLHILFNMLFLWWFGKTLETMFGSREFLLFYLAGAIVSGIVFVGLGLAMRDLAAAIGASGAVMAVVMVYAMYYPREKIYIWGIIPVEIRWLVAAYVFFDLLPVLEGLAGGGNRDGVAHSAHLGGLAFGFLYKTYNWRLSQIFSGFKLSRWKRSVGPRRKIKIYEPSPRDREESLEDQVDAILEKISSQGEASLSDREREILKTASHRYKNR